MMRISDVVGGVFVGFALCFAHIVGAAQIARLSEDGVWSTQRDYPGYYEPDDHWLAKYPEYACILAQCIVLDPEAFAAVAGAWKREPVGAQIRDATIEHFPYNEKEFMLECAKEPLISTVARHLKGVTLETNEYNTSAILIKLHNKLMPMFLGSFAADAASLESFMFRTMIRHPGKVKIGEV